MNQQAFFLSSLLPAFSLRCSCLFPPFRLGSQKKYAFYEEA